MSSGIDPKGAKLQFKFPDDEWVDLGCAEVVDFNPDVIEIADPTGDITGVDLTLEASFTLEFAAKGIKEHLIRFISKKWFRRYAFKKFHKTMKKLSEESEMVRYFCDNCGVELFGDTGKFSYQSLNVSGDQKESDFKSSHFCNLKCRSEMMEKDGNQVLGNIMANLGKREFKK